MRAMIIVLAAWAVAGSALAAGSHYTRSYVRSNGTYVPAARATNPNYTRNDNWSTRPNVNPYTGRTGTKTPDYGYTYKAPKAPKTGF